MTRLVCYKEIIDSLAALQRQIKCTEVSLTAALLPGGTGHFATEADVEEVRKLADPLARCLFKLEAKAREGDAPPGGDGRDG